MAVGFFSWSPVPFLFCDQEDGKLPFVSGRAPSPLAIRKGPLSYLKNCFSQPSIHPALRSIQNSIFILFLLNLSSLDDRLAFLPPRQSGDAGRSTSVPMIGPPRFKDSCAPNRQVPSLPPSRKQWVPAQTQVPLSPPPIDIRFELIVVVCSPPPSSPETVPPVWRNGSAFRQRGFHRALLRCYLPPLSVPPPLPLKTYTCHFPFVLDSRFFAP